MEELNCICVEDATLWRYEFVMLSYICAGQSMFFDGEECAGVVILLSELSLCVTFWDG